MTCAVLAPRLHLTDIETQISENAQQFLRLRVTQFRGLLSSIDVFRIVKEMNRMRQNLSGNNS
jgi:hypothetical protein